jgi:hypothetical protein
VAKAVAKERVANQEQQILEQILEPELAKVSDLTKAARKQKASLAPLEEEEAAQDRQLRQYLLKYLYSLIIESSKQDQQYS